MAMWDGWCSCSFVQVAGIFDASRGDELLLIGALLFAAALVPAAGLAWYAIHLVVMEIDKT